MHWKRSFYRRIILFFLGLILILILSFAAVFIHIVGSQYRETAIESAQTSARAVSNGIETYLKGLDEALNDLYTYAGFLEHLNDAGIGQRAEPTFHLLSDTQYYRYRNGVYVYNNAHELRSAKRREKNPLTNDLYPSISQEDATRLRTAVEQESRAFFALVTTDDKGTPHLWAVKRLYQDMGRFVCGYVVCDLQITPLVQITTSAPSLSSQSFWLSDSAGGQVGLTAAPEVIETISENAAQDGVNSIPRRFSFLYRSDSGASGLRVNVYTNESSLKTAYVTLLHSMSVISVLVILLMCAVAWAISHMAGKRVRSLTDTMSAIAEGQNQLRLTDGGRDEIDVLCHHFNELMDRVELITREEAKTRRALQDAKYLALQAQVNPHFLYNTLDTISAVADANETALVRKMCDGLSDMFRYATRTDAPDRAATLREETQHVHQYLTIMNVRLGGQIQWTQQIDEELWKMRIPLLSLQPIVENAVKHGLRSKRGEKHIWLDAHQHQGVLTITIRDNGQKGNAQRITQAICSGMSDAETRHTSIGLHNIHERIQLRYGTVYGLSAQCDEQGTRIVMRLPCQTEEDIAS